MKIIIICLLFLSFQRLEAQSLKWFEGSLVLSNCEVKIGRMSIEHAHNLILFQEDDKRTVYPAHQIKSLYFYDEDANINRRYLSLKKQENARTSFELYEIVIAGEASMLRKAALRLKHPDVLDYNYFIHYNNVLTPLRKFNRNVYPQLLSNASTKLEEYVSINRLSARDPANAIRIIEFYNNLFQSGEPLARQN